MLIAAGRGFARVPTCEQALGHVRTKFYHLIEAKDERWFMADRLRYDLGFEEWQDDHDVKTRRHCGMGFRTARVDDFVPLLARALSLFGPGELPALRVLDVDVFRLVTSLTREASSSGGGPAPHMGQATDALCAIHVAPCFSTSSDNGSLAALLQRHSSTITELDAKYPTKMLLTAASALARCTRLESLTDASCYTPAAWLGLSQLHTLRGVDLSKVPTAAIAAALPRLHTLKAHSHSEEPAQVAGFFTDLLPRLRVFDFQGRWPEAQELPASTVAPLPLLQELVWNASRGVAPREFLGAQPTVLHVPHKLISQCGLGAVDEATSFLARVSDLRISAPVVVDALDPADVARVLRAGLQLKKFHTAHSVHPAASWLAPTAPPHPAFEGLVHPRLREFGIRTSHAEITQGTSPGAEWAAHLRRRHFPRLRELSIGDKACFITPLDVVGSRNSPNPS
jgi:hypothetical protein